MAFKEFIDQKLGAGSFDSEGGFTILRSKAVNKTAGYSLSDPRHWMLKMVQTAVALECDRIDFKANRDSWEVKLWGGGGLNLENLAAKLSTSVQSCTKAESELYLALKSLLPRHRFRIRDEALRSFHWSGEKLEQYSSRPPKTFSTLELSVSRKLLPDAPGPELGKASVEVLKHFNILQKRALFAPLKLVFDSRLISPATVSLQQFGSGQSQAALHLLDAALNEEESKIEFGDSRLGQDAARTRTPLLTARPAREAVIWQAQIGLNYRRPHLRTHLPDEVVGAPFRVYFGRLGIVCQELRADDQDCSGLLYYELGSDFGDLSGLKVSSTESDWELHKESAQRFKLLLKVLAVRLSEHEPVRHKQERTLRETAKLAAEQLGYAGVIGLLLGSAKLIPTALIGGVAYSTLSVFELAGRRAAFRRETYKMWSQTVSNFSAQECWTDRNSFEEKELP